MLIITRKKSEKIMIGENIEITILNVGRRRVRFGIKAPKEVVVHSKLRESLSKGEAIPDESQELPNRDVA